VLAPDPVGERVTSRVTSHVEVTEIDRSYEVVAQARQQGFEGDPCDECGEMMMVRNGTCLKCMNCGSTSGCS
jgi:ribonucleoside-diphosphate reductase alpha chain